MREHPWHLRRTGHSHAKRFANLRDLHAITVDALNVVDDAAALDARGLELLKTLSTPAVSAGTWPWPWDETLPDEWLGRLEYQIHVAQGLMLSRARKEKHLEQIWKSAEASGGRCAQERWPAPGPRPATDLRAAFAAFRDSPVSGFPGKSNAQPMLVKRATACEMQLQFLSCAHFSETKELRSIADDFCRLHFHWTRGWLAFICPRATLESGEENGGKTEGRPCLQKWVL